jgi:cell wall assembly regulator SMI1
LPHGHTPRGDIKRKFTVVPIPCRSAYDRMVYAVTLADALTVFERELARVSPMTIARLGPGLPAEEARQTLLRLNLGTPNDVLEWFMWHNGSSTPDEQFWSSVPIGPARWLASLTDFAYAYGEWIDFIRDNLPDRLRHEQGWFPVVGDTSGGYVVIDCTGENTGQPTQCALRTPEGRWTATLSFEDCIRSWADAIASGRWQCEEDRRDYPDWTVYPDRGTIPPGIGLTGLLT